MKSEIITDLSGLKELSEYTKPDIPLILLQDAVNHCDGIFENQIQEFYYDLTRRNPEDEKLYLDLGFEVMPVDIPDLDGHASKDPIVSIEENNETHELSVKLYATTYNEKDFYTGVSELENFPNNVSEWKNLSRVSLKNQESNDFKGSFVVMTSVLNIDGVYYGFVADTCFAKEPIDKETKVSNLQPHHYPEENGKVYLFKSNDGINFLFEKALLCMDNSIVLYDPYARITQDGKLEVITTVMQHHLLTGYEGNSFVLFTLDDFDDENPKVETILKRKNIGPQSQIHERNPDMQEFSGAEALMRFMCSIFLAKEGWGTRQRAAAIHFYQNNKPQFAGLVIRPEQLGEDITEVGRPFTVQFKDGTPYEDEEGNRYTFVMCRNRVLEKNGYFDGPKNDMFWKLYLLKYKADAYDKTIKDRVQGIFV